MTDTAAIEQQIRDLLRTETRAPVLSNKLFGQFTGLFCQLGATEADRRRVSQSELFRQAQARLRELERLEVEALRKAAQVVRQELPEHEFTLRLDTAPAGR